MFKSVQTYEVLEHLIEQVRKAAYDNSLEYRGINPPEED